MRLPRSVRIGWESVKANAVPMVVLWVLAGALVIGYYFVLWFSNALRPLYRWQTSGGWEAAFFESVLFLWAFAGIFSPVEEWGRAEVFFLTIIVQTIFAGACGIICDWMYTFHAWLLGTGIDAGTVVVKTMLNQFVFRAWRPHSYRLRSLRLGGESLVPEGGMDYCFRDRTK